MDWLGTSSTSPGSNSQSCGSPVWFGMFASPASASSTVRKKSPRSPDQLYSWVRMRSGTRRGTIGFFIALGAGLVGAAVALNVGWIIVSWRNVGLLVLGLLV